MVAVAVVLERLTNDVHNAPNHRTHLTRIVLNSLHNYEMDIPYRGTWWTLADSMLRINSRDWFDKLELKVWAHSVDIWRWLRSIFNQFRQFGIEKFSLSSKTIYRNSVHWEQSSTIGDLCIMNIYLQLFSVQVYDDIEFYDLRNDIANDSQCRANCSNSIPHADPVRWFLFIYTNIT